MTIQNNTFTIEADQESINYLQRLGYEIDSYMSVIDFLFSAHKDDPEFVDSEIFRAYQIKFEKVKVEYSKAKEEYGQKILRPIVEEHTGKAGIDFNWSIPVFADKKVFITYN